MSSTKVFLVLIAIAVVAAVAWFLASPLFIDQTVEESFPQARKPVLEQGVKTAEPLKDDASEDLEKQKEEILAAAADEPAHEMQEAMPDASGEPTLIAQGKFKNADASHQGSGDAKLYQLADGRHLIRLENFNVTNGPDLHVYLAKHAAPETASQVTDEGYFDLGKLKGNVGNQNYEVPEDITVADYKSVVIWCRLFSVLFSPASLQ